MIPVIIGTLGTVSKSMEKTGRTENQRKNRDYPNYSILNIGLNSGKSFRDRRRFAITQTPVKDILLKLSRKTHNNNNGVLKYKRRIESRLEDKTLVLIKKKRNYIVDFAVLADIRMKVKEAEKLDKY